MNMWTMRSRNYELEYYFREGGRRYTLTHLEFPDDIFSRRDGKFSFLLFPPEQEVVVWEGIFSVHEEVHQVVRHLPPADLEDEGGVLDRIPLVGRH